MISGMWISTPCFTKLFETYVIHGVEKKTNQWMNESKNNSQEISQHPEVSKVLDNFVYL